MPDVRSVVADTVVIPDSCGDRRRTILFMEGSTDEGSTDSLVLLESEMEFDALDT